MVSNKVQNCLARTTFFVTKMPTQFYLGLPHKSMMLFLSTERKEIPFLLSQRLLQDIVKIIQFVS